VSRVVIRTPVTDHSGVVGNVYITDGVGHADSVQHAAEIAYCVRNGYTVEEIPDEPGDTSNPAEPSNDETAPDGDEPPRRNASTEAWRAYAVAHGIPADEADALTRDQLVERVSSSEETTE
jgi:hypothetical protein